LDSLASSRSMNAANTYPGDDYVYIVAPTAYRNDLAIPNYDECIQFNKPLAMAEYGSADTPSTTEGSFNNALYTQIITKQYPGIAYFVCWYNWQR